MDHIECKLFDEFYHKTRPQYFGFDLLMSFHLFRITKEIGNDFLESTDNVGTSVSHDYGKI